jgi:hypothetical protein
VRAEEEIPIAVPYGGDKKKFALEAENYRQALRKGSEAYPAKAREGGSGATSPSIGICED